MTKQKVRINQKLDTNQPKTGYELTGYETTWVRMAMYRHVLAIFAVRLQYLNKHLMACHVPLSTSTNPLLNN